MRKFKFENLDVWNLAMRLGEDLNTELIQFPQHEKYNLASQMLRAVDSIALNIAEGSIGQTNPEFRRFLSYAIRSTAETATCLIKALQRGYISQHSFQAYYDQCHEIINKLVALRRSL